jgi:hypothetical protein
MLAQDLIHVIFEDMDPIWLRSMWETRGSARANMIEILISLALLKLSLGFDLLIFCELYCRLLFWVVSIFLLMV